MGVPTFSSKITITANRDYPNFLHISHTYPGILGTIICKRSHIAICAKGICGLKRYRCLGKTGRQSNNQNRDQTQLFHNYFSLKGHVFSKQFRKTALGAVFISSALLSSQELALRWIARSIGTCRFARRSDQISRLTEPHERKCLCQPECMIHQTALDCGGKSNRRL